MRTNVVLFCALAVAGLLPWSGCKSAELPQRQAPSRKPLSPPESNERRDVALLSFIQGAIRDLQGEYAEAILEYQEALRIQPNAAIYYAISRDYSSLGKHARAADAAREAVRLDSTNIRYRENLASVYLNALQPDLAIREYEEIIRIDSTSTLAWYNLARLYQPQRPLRALEIYQRLLDREGNDWDILFQSATIYGSLGRYDEAAAMLRRMLELDPGNRALQRQLAETYAKAGKVDEAVHMLEALVERDPRDAETVAALADVYLEQKKFDNAVTLYERLLAQGIENPEVKLRVGIGLFAQSERDSSLIPRARQVFEEVRAALPGDWRPYWYLGAMAANQKNDSLATANFERVTALAPWNGDAWWYLGTSHFDRGQYDKVLEIMERAKKAVPRDHRVYLLLGLTYSRLDRPDDAVPMLEKAYQMNPNDLNTLSSLALVYDGLKRYNDSDRLYEEALKLDPKSALVLNNYSYSLAERGLQLDRALVMAQQAVSAEPENPSYLDTLGWIFFKLGKYLEAEEYIAKAVEREHASSVVHEHLGDVCFKLGKKDKALELWKEASELDPKNQAARDKAQRGTL